MFVNDKVNKYNNTFHRKTKMLMLMKNQTDILTLVKKIITRKILNLKLLIMLEYQNIKIFLQKVTLQIGLNKFLLSQKLKVLLRGHMLLAILTENKLLEPFTKRYCKKQIKKSLELKK